MSRAPRLRAMKRVGFALAMMFVPLANADVTFNFSVTPSSIVAGGSALLDLHTNGQNLGGPNRFIQSIDLTFSSGDGQSFHLASSVSPSLTNDFQHQFTYLSSGVFSPSILGSVSGVQLDASNANGFGQDVNLSSRLEVTAAVGSVPEPASTAMLVIGLTLLAASRRRRQADRVN